MKPLEKLSPFVSLCQACGVIPYTMEYDATNRKFIGFNFSFKHLTTWWFIFILILQSVSPWILVDTSEEYLKLLSGQPNVPITMKILGDVTVACYFYQVALSRWIMLFRHRRLKRVLEAMQKLERLIQIDNEGDNLKNSFTKRFIFGFVLNFLTVSPNY